MADAKLSGGYAVGGPGPVVPSDPGGEHTAATKIVTYLEASMTVHVNTGPDGGIHSIHIAPDAVDRSFP